MAFCAEIWQQKRLRFPLEVAAFSLYTDDSYLIRYREIDMFVVILYFPYGLINLDCMLPFM